ncbi:tyrosine-type recombinase/integrase [Streptomyces sp. NPDC090442]|uniref:tyrosine-type recombinase/integrase n=1 Tax=Streptomyces sp. NPDC090442 TaxID=3365962 RepID=UPI003829BB91
MAGWRLDSLPRGLTPQQVAALLSAPDLRTAAGRRDRAILVMLARLGLRGAEAAAIQLSDIDWHAGEIAVRGKGSCTERLPLPTEVGESVAGYLTNSRPRCSATAVFVTSRAPYQALTGTCIRAIMGRACDRAGLPRGPSHGEPGPDQPAPPHRPDPQDHDQRRSPAHGTDRGCPDPPLCPARPSAHPTHRP